MTREDFVAALRAVAFHSKLLRQTTIETATLGDAELIAAVCACEWCAQWNAALLPLVLDVSTTVREVLLFLGHTHCCGCLERSGPGRGFATPDALLARLPEARLPEAVRWRRAMAAWKDEHADHPAEDED